MTDSISNTLADGSTETVDFHSLFLILILLPQYLFFITFCKALWNWFTETFKYITHPFISKHKLLFILFVLNVVILLLFGIFCIEEFILRTVVIQLAAVILSSVSLLTCTIIVIYSYMCGKSLCALHQLSPSHAQPNWSITSKLFVTELCILSYFLFQFILSLNSIAIGLQYTKLVNFIALYLLSDVILLLCIFRGTCTRKMECKCVIFHTNVSESVQHKKDATFQSHTDHEWNEYLKVEQYNVLQNIPYLQPIHDAIPPMDSNDIHLREMKLILQLKLWIQHYGIPAVMNGNQLFQQMQKLQKAVTNAKEEADELDEETMQLMQQVFSLEQEVVELETMYTSKCDELKLVGENRDESSSDNPRFINPAFQTIISESQPCQKRKQNVQEKKTRLRIHVNNSNDQKSDDSDQTHQTLTHEILQLKRLFQLKTDQCNKVKQQLYLKSLDSMATQPPNFASKTKSVRLDKLWKTHFTQSRTIKDIPIMSEDEKEHQYTKTKKLNMNCVSVPISPLTTPNLLSVKLKMSDVKSYNDISDQIVKGIKPGYMDTKSAEKTSTFDSTFIGPKRSLSMPNVNKSNSLTKISETNTDESDEEYDSDDDEYGTPILFQIKNDNVPFYVDNQLIMKIQQSVNETKKGELFYGKYMNSEVVKHIQKGCFCSVNDVKEIKQNKAIKSANSVFMRANEEKENVEHGTKQTANGLWATARLSDHNSKSNIDENMVYVDDSYLKQPTASKKYALKIPSLNSIGRSAGYRNNKKKSGKLLENDADHGL